MTRHRFSRTVLLLGTASFFNDLSGEMVYPLLPLFLATALGGGALQLGLIEGVAESTASFLKVGSGLWTDSVQRRNPFIFAGYAVAGIARSLIGFAQSWPNVLSLRFLDRLGKGVRTSPRDALIADVTPEPHRGKAYGLQRAMDHAGAIGGPLIAALLLSAGLSIRTVFMSAAVPAVIVIACLLFLKKETPALPTVEKASPASWRDIPAGFKKFLLAVFLFELGGSTDAFLLLRLADVGISPTHVAFLWSGLHVIKMSTTYLFGSLADRRDKRSLMAAGWALYTVIYFLIGKTSSPTLTVCLFLIYGIYFGLTEPTERAFISQMAGDNRRGTYFGFYHGTVGLAALPAGLLFGFFWNTWGAPSAFYLAAALSGLACLVLATLYDRSHSKP